MMMLVEYIPGLLWLQEYPIHFTGCDFNSRMAVIKVARQSPTQTVGYLPQDCGYPIPS